MNRSMQIRAAWAMAGVGILTFTVAMAQSSELALEEVVVTAQKRVENVREVPMAVSVVSGEKLDNGGYNSLLDVAKLTPSMAYVQSADPRTTTFSIRGIGSPGNIPGVEPSAAIIIDDETLARSAQLSYDIADLERVEVLKGPQGTLLGKNASAGALNIVTKRPSLDGFSADVRLTLAEDNETKTKIAVNVPMTENSALRVNGFYNYVGGWAQNVDSSQPNGGQEQGSGGRAQYLIKPTDQLTILARAEYVKKNYGPYAQVINQLGVGDLTNASLAGFTNMATGDTITASEYQAALNTHPELKGMNPVQYMLLHSGQALPLIDNTRTSQVAGRDYGNLQNHAYSLEVDYDLGRSTLVYNGSYRKWDLYTNEDQDLIATQTMPLYFAGSTNEKSSQHDLRLVSNEGGALSYVAGLYNYRNTNYRSEHDQECYASIYGFAVNAGDWGIDLNSPVRYNANGSIDCGNGKAFDSEEQYESHIDTLNNAVYGQLDWHVSDKLTLIGGGRLLREEQTMYYYRPTGAQPVTSQMSWKTSDTAFIYKLGGKYQLNNAMFYVTYATGYKGAAWDNSAGRVVNDFGDGHTWPLQPEKPTQIEAGVRSNWFNNRLQADLTVFHTRTEHFQAKGRFYNDILPGGVVNQVMDVGDVLAKGIEAEFQLVATNHWRFNGAIAYLDASLQDDTYVACSIPNRQAGRCVLGSAVGFNSPKLRNRYLFNVKGQQLPSSPEWVYNVGATYDFTLPGNYRSDVRAEYRYRSREQFELTGDPFQTRDSFGITDLYFDVNSPGAKYSLTLFVKNVFSKLYFERSFEPTVNDYNAGESAYLPRDYQRYMGVTFRAGF